MLYLMTALVKARPYNSRTRQMQLTATKAAIVEAARELMVKHGYEATTMEQIAAGAGVAVQTVYKHFGSKPAIVAAFVALARQDPRLVEQRERLLETPDPREQVRLLAQRARLYAEMGMPALIMAARGQDLNLARSIRRQIATVRRSHLEYARALQRKGGLRAGITLEQAVDYIGLLSAPDRFWMMQHDRGWSFDRCEAWLAETLIRLLLD
jgi:AcrR family transcriptional regulator